METRRQTLAVGDYCLKGAETLAVIERKGSISEIAKNMLDRQDLARQLRAFDRLSAACEYPILLVEQTVGELLRPTKYAPDPGRAIDELFRWLAHYRIHLWLVGQCRLPARRRLVGELVLRALVAYLEKDKFSA